MLGLHCTHFLRPQYPSNPPPLFPIYHRTVHRPQQAWFYCPTLIVVQSAHHALPLSAPSQPPCVVVERLEGKQQCSRAPVGEHAEVRAQDAECGCHEQQDVNEKRPDPRNSPSHNHDSTAPRQIRSSILVRGRSIWSMARSGRQPRKQLPRKDSHFRHFGGSWIEREGKAFRHQI